MAWRLFFFLKKLIAFSIIKISHLLWNPKLLPFSQGLSVRPWPRSFRSNSHAHVMFFRRVLILYSHLFLTLPTGVMTPRFSHFTLTFILYVNRQRFSWCLSCLPGFLDNKEVMMFPLVFGPLSQHGNAEHNYLYFMLWSDYQILFTVLLFWKHVLSVVCAQ